MAMRCGTLTLDDIRQATMDVMSQRSAIRARYDYEMKQLETKITDLEMLEHSVLKFVSNFKVEDGPSETVADPEPTMKKATDEIASEQGSSTSSQTPAERAILTLIDPGDSRAAGVTDEAVEKELSDRVWTPTERALLALKRGA
jgi:hypothetical protein